VGAPLLGMHSCRELVATADIGLMAHALRACLIN
jgi:aspartyl aminopeptidase